MDAPPNYQTVSFDSRKSCRGAIGTLDVSIESVALARLIEEVGGHTGVTLSGYNRTYHRHNR